MKTNKLTAIDRKIKAGRELRENLTAAIDKVLTEGPEAVSVERKKTPSLTAKAVAAARVAGYYRDGQTRHGLHLQVSKAGTKSWIMRFTIAGRVREMGLGSAAEGEVSLAEARAAAAKARALIREGIDPIEERDKRREFDRLVKDLRFAADAARQS